MICGVGQQQQTQGGDAHQSQEACELCTAAHVSERSSGVQSERGGQALRSRYTTWLSWETLP